MTTTVEAVYEEHVKSLSVREKLQLITLITEQLAAVSDVELLSNGQTNGEAALQTADFEILGYRKGSPQAILQFAETLSVDEAESVLLTVKEARSIDEEMWK